MTGRWVVLEPLDTVTIRDGRGFDMGMDAVAHLMLPTPATFAGAIGAVYDPTPGLGRRDPAARGTKIPSEIRGPVTVRRISDGRWEALFPVPHDVVMADGEMTRLAMPSGRTGVETDLDGEAPLLLEEPRGELASCDRHWWDSGQLAEYLHMGGLSPVLLTKDGERVYEPWKIERRVGIAREESRTVSEGMFYSSEHLRLQQDVGFAGECVGGPDRKLGGTVPFGGEGRRAEVHGDVPGIEFPDVPESFPGGELLLYLASPAVFPGGSWRPDLGLLNNGNVELVAAAVGKTRVITSGTPDRRTGKFSSGRLMWAVPPGAVYYLRFPDATAAKAAARRVHGTTISQAEDWMRTAGFGLVLTGRWGNPTEKEHEG
jgi:CRISPR type III-B/RAMP module-associated protein Cmr3